MIKAILFDMDGVLIEAKDWHYQALNRALQLFGYEISRYEHLVTYDGLPTKRKLQMLSAERGLPVELHEFINEMKQKYTMELIHTKCKPLFVHEYALAKLRKDGYKLAVASNSIRNTVEVMMKYSCLDKYLDVMLSNEDVKRAKPYPDIYQAAIEKFGLTPQECLVVEDNEKGFAAAQAAGAHLMAVNTVNDVNLENIYTHIKRSEENYNEYSFISSTRSCK